MICNKTLKNKRSLAAHEKTNAHAEMVNKQPQLVNLAFPVELSHAIMTFANANQQAPPPPPPSHTAAELQPQPLFRPDDFYDDGGFGDLNEVEQAAPPQTQSTAQQRSSSHAPPSPVPAQSPLDRPGASDAFNDIVGDDGGFEDACWLAGGNNDANVDGETADDDDCDPDGDHDDKVLSAADGKRKRLEPHARSDPDASVLEKRVRIVEPGIAAAGQRHIGPPPAPAGVQVSAAPPRMSIALAPQAALSIGVVLTGDSMRKMLASPTFQALFWQNLGTNSSTKQNTRETRAVAGIKLLRNYLDHITDKGGILQPVRCASTLEDYTSFAVGAAIVRALKASAQSPTRGGGSPIAYLELSSDKDSDVVAYLAKLGLSKTTALTSLAMVRAICRWFTRCLREVEQAGEAVARDIFGFVEGFATAAEAPLKRLSQFKRDSRKAASSHNMELWALPSDEYCALLFTLYGELVYHLERDVAQLVGRIRDLEPENVDERKAIASAAWNLLALIASGVGSFSVVGGFTLTLAC